MRERVCQVLRLATIGPMSQESGAKIEVSGVRFQVSVVKSESLSSIEYPASSIELLNSQFAIVLRTPTLRAGSQFRNLTSDISNPQSAIRNTPHAPRIFILAGP
jgi:hypothetical protein